MITGSIVAFHNPTSDLKKVIDSFLGDYKNRFLFIIDNSKDNSLSVLCQDTRIRYIFNNKNVGFGAAHNIAFREAFLIDSLYHVILNPDICFEPSIIDSLITEVDSDSSIGLIMPKILYPDGKTQYLCKLIPTPLDLFLRRFLFIKKLNSKLDNRYELRFFSYNEKAEIPILSGCFMMLRISVIKNINGFDERFFMYLEDIDLCRRVGEDNKVVFYPHVEITHNYEKGSYKNKLLLYYHIKSAIKYFNKWGWFYDKKRKEINKNVLQKLGYKNERNNISRWFRY